MAISPGESPSPSITIIAILAGTPLPTLSKAGENATDINECLREPQWPSIVPPGARLIPGLAAKRIMS